MAEMIIKNHIEAHTYDIDTQQKDFLNAVNNCSAYTLDIEYKLNIHLKDDSEANAPKKGDAKDLVKLPKVEPAIFLKIAT